MVTHTVRLVGNIYKMASSCSQMEESRSSFKIVTGKRLLGRSRRRWEDNIGMDLKEIGINRRNWVFYPLSI